MAIIEYHPAPTIKEFIKHYKPAQFFADWIIGPVGSGKTTGIFMKLARLSMLQAKSPITGKRHVRAVIVRNTMPQLKDTTIKSWNYWFKEGEAGDWNATDKNFTLKFGDVECEVLFRPLDTADDVDRVLSLEITFAILDEFVQIPQQIVDAVAARCGRYPPEKDGGATNWGMWGSSNPGNEDDWWYDALMEAEQFGESEQQKQIRINERILKGKGDETTWTFFQQPSGFADNAENLNNLPGKVGYYKSLAKDHPVHWVKQFIEGEWGYSLAGKPVIATFAAETHVAKQSLRYNPGLPLIGGLDPGMNTAMIFGQMDHFGRLNVLAELITRDYGAKRFIADRLMPLLNSRFRGAEFIVSPDPAGIQRSQTDEKSVVDVFRQHFRVVIPTLDNRLPGRIAAIEYFTSRITENGPALQVDPAAKGLIRALRSGWRYSTDTKGDTKETPVKNAHSHPGDGFAYLCQYFYVDNDRKARRKNQAPAVAYSNPYVFR